MKWRAFAMRDLDAARAHALGGDIAVHLMGNLTGDMFNKNAPAVFHGKRFAHLFGPDVDTLTSAAALLGCNPKWIQHADRGPRYAHFDLVGAKLKAALARCGAVETARAIDDAPAEKWSALFSAETDEWSSPDDVFAFWNERVGPFTLDAAADAGNAKCARFYTAADDGPTRDWVKDAAGGAVFVNPPYSDIGPFVTTAIDASARGAVVCMLLPSRTDRPWFHDLLAVQKRCEFWFCRGRLRFGTATADAPFPSCVVVLRPERAV